MSGPGPGHASGQARQFLRAERIHDTLGCAAGGIEGHHSAAEREAFARVFSGVSGKGADRGCGCR